jgi:hypothetical protein
VAEKKKQRGRIENLKPWKPGQSGNSQGYSRKRRIQDRLNEILDRTRDGKTIEEAICEQIAHSALHGDINAFVAIADRTDGKPRQAIEHSGPDGGSIPITLPEVQKRIAELLAAGGYREPASRTADGNSSAPGNGELAKEPSGAS